MTVAIKPRHHTELLKRSQTIPVLPFSMFVAVGMFVGMAVGMGVFVYVLSGVFVAMRGFGLHLDCRLYRVGPPLHSLHQSPPCRCRRIGDLLPTQVTSQCLELRKGIRLVLHAPQGLAQGHLQQQGRSILMVTHEMSI